MFFGLYYATNTVWDIAYPCAMNGFPWPQAQTLAQRDSAATCSWSQLLSDRAGLSDLSVLGHGSPGCVQPRPLSTEMATLYVQ